jgi:hypothetical protein
MRIAERWRGLRRWERAVWVASGGLLVLCAAWPVVLRTFAPSFALEASTIDAPSFPLAWAVRQMRGLLLVAALLPLYFLHVPYVRWPRVSPAREVAYIAAIALLPMGLCLKAAFFAVGVPLLIAPDAPELSPSLAIEPVYAVLVSTALAIALVATIARLTLRGPSADDPSPPSAAGGSPS